MRDDFVFWLYLICLGKISGRIPKPALLDFFLGGSQIPPTTHIRSYKEGWPNRNFGHVKWSSKTSISTSPTRNFALRWLVPPAIRPCFWGVVALQGVEFINMKIMFSKNSRCFCRWFKENEFQVCSKNMWGLPHVTEIYLEGNKPWINPCTWNVWVKIGHIILYMGINNNVWKPPSTCTLAHKHRDTRTQTHTSIHVIVHQDIVGICVTKTADGWSHGRDSCEFNSRPGRFGRIPQMINHLS